MRPCESLRRLISNNRPGDYLKSNDEAIRTAAIQLAGEWKRAELVAPLLVIAAEGESTAFDSLIQIRGPQTFQGLKALAAADKPAGTRQAAARALGRMRPSARAAA